MALALDGSVHGNATAASLAVSLTTANANDVIEVCVLCNGGPVTSVTASGLTFTKRVSDNHSGFPAETEEIWRAIAPSALSAVSITVNQTSSAFITVDAFGISGADTTTIFDSNASIPPHNGASSGFTDITFTTSNANDFIFAAYRFGSTPTPTEGAGWTKISGADYQLVEYKIVSTTQTSLDATIGTGTGDNAASVGDAIIQFVAVATQPLAYVTPDLFTPGSGPTWGLSTPKAYPFQAAVLGSIGSSVGAAVVSGVGASQASSVGSSVGAATVTGISSAGSVGASVGAATVTGVSASIAASVGSAVGQAVVAAYALGKSGGDATPGGLHAGLMKGRISAGRIRAGRMKR